MAQSTQSWWNLPEDYGTSQYDLPDYGLAASAGLAANTSALPTGANGRSMEDLIAAIRANRQQVNPPPETASTDSRWGANLQAMGTLGLGLASFLDNKKTAKLQREGMKLNLDLAKEHQANRQALNRSWNEGWGQ